ncbi:MAG: HAMP domain-containing sensor histidine kinase [Anaerolineae bacterium]
MSLGKRLWFRLTLPLVLIPVLTVLVVALMTETGVSGGFRQYLMRRDALLQSSWLDQLTAYYQQAGTWSGVASVFSSLEAVSTEDRGHGAMNGGGMGMGLGAAMGMRQPTILLADANGLIIYDQHHQHEDQWLDADERASALPVALADGSVVGYLTVTSAGSLSITPAEQDFLARLQQTLIIAALVASAIGIAVGLLISRRITVPLNKLTSAARSFATHDWNQRVTINDTTELGQVGQAFNGMADELQRAEVLRRNLMADIAHELRTPLSVMQANLSALLDGVYPLERSEIASLYDETRLLSRLVNDLRDLALAEAGKLPLAMQRVDTGTVLQSVVTKFTVAAEAQDVHVTLQLDPDLPALQADPERLEQILHNLLSNALRHTSTGSVTVTGSARLPAVYISVADSGEGIAADDLPRVFDRFYRGDRSRSRSSGGIGLGLAIVKAWVNAMNGQVGVESAAGQGARFWFTLPAAPEH